MEKHPTRGVLDVDTVNVTPYWMQSQLTCEGSLLAGVIQCGTACPVPPGCPGIEAGQEPGHPLPARLACVHVDPEAELESKAHQRHRSK